LGEIPTAFLFEPNARGKIKIISKGREENND
jgi:hypothetical protein